MTPAKLVALIVKKAAAGVDYSPKKGAICPNCKLKAKVYCTLPWEGNTRVRYHHCHNEQCIVCSVGATIKSIEVDMVVTDG